MYLLFSKYVTFTNLNLAQRTLRQVRFGANEGVFQTRKQAHERPAASVGSQNETAENGRRRREGEVALSDVALASEEQTPASLSAAGKSVREQLRRL